MRQVPPLARYMIKRFVESECKLGEDLAISWESLYADYRAWERKNREEIETRFHARVQITESIFKDVIKGHYDVSLRRVGTSYHVRMISAARRIPVPVLAQGKLQDPSA